MLKVVVTNKPGTGNSALASALNQWFNLECETLNIPSDILYETANVIQPDIYILNKGSFSNTVNKKVSSFRELIL